MTNFDMFLGGPTIKVWDCYQRKLLTQLSNHTKTVTSVCLSHDNTKIISAGLGLILDNCVFRFDSYCIGRTWYGQKSRKCKKTRE